MYLSALRKKKDKRGISVVLGYALLIGMSISLSVLVFQWLRYYVDDGSGENLNCPEGANIIITEANCVKGPGGYLNITLKNKGRHNLDGFGIRVNERADAKQGLDKINLDDTSIQVGQTYTESYPLSNVGLTDIKFVEVQSYKIISNKTIYCNFIDSMKIECDPASP
jgi:hypothetical protein